MLKRLATFSDKLRENDPEGPNAEQDAELDAILENTLNQLLN